MKKNKHSNRFHSQNNQSQQIEDQQAQQVTEQTSQPVSRSVAKEIEREEFLKKIRKTRSLKALLRDCQKEELQEYQITFNTVVSERIAELQEIEDKQLAELKAAEDTVRELREKGINLEMIKDILSK